METTRSASLLKGFGYLISIGSVLFLGAVAWGSTDGSPRLRLCLAAGMITSIIGMALRWQSFRLQQRQERLSVLRRA